MLIVYLEDTIGVKMVALGNYFFQVSQLRRNFGTNIEIHIYIFRFLYI